MRGRPRSVREAIEADQVQWADTASLTSFLPTGRCTTPAMSPYKIKGKSAHRAPAAMYWTTEMPKCSSRIVCRPPTAPASSATTWRHSCGQV